MNGVHILCWHNYGNVEPVSIFIEEGIMPDKEAVYVHMHENSDDLLESADSLHYVDYAVALNNWPEIADLLKDIGLCIPV